MGRSRLFIGVSLALVAIVAGFVLWRAGLVQERTKKALELAKQGDFWEAEPILKETLVRDPRHVDVLQALAKGYLKNGRKGEADECLTRWLTQAPREPEALLLRQELYRDLGQFDKALADIDRLLEIEAQNIAWRRKRVAVLYSAGRFSDAETECQRCLQALPGDAGLRRSLAEIKRARGELTEAGVILDSMLRDSPRDTAAMMTRALLHLSQDEPAKSIPLFRTVLELDKNKQRRGRYHLALALNRVGQTEEASRLMEEVRRMQQADVLLLDSKGQPDNLPLQIRNARAQFEDNKLDLTLSILDQVFNIDANYAPAHALKADVLDQQGRFDQAAEHRRRAKENP
jgi:tetratricopeptide (TPR) repeat protein